jgi:hypothetical protein
MAGSSTGVANLLTITVNDLISFKPCYKGEQLKKLITLFRSRPVWTALDVAALTQYPARDRLWLMLRPELIPDRTLHELACVFAERALEEERMAGREPDKRLWAAIEAKRKWLAGDISDAELAAAAWSAASRAALDVALAASRAALDVALAADAADAADAAVAAADAAVAAADADAAAAAADALAASRAALDVALAASRAALDVALAADAADAAVAAADAAVAAADADAAAAAADAAAAAADATRVEAADAAMNDALRAASEAAERWPLIVRSIHLMSKYGDAGSVAGMLVSLSESLKTHSATVLEVAKHPVEVAGITANAHRAALELAQRFYFDVLRSCEPIQSSPLDWPAETLLAAVQEAAVPSDEDADRLAALIEIERAETITSGGSQWQLDRVVEAIDWQ